MPLRIGSVASYYRTCLLRAVGFPVALCALGVTGCTGMGGSNTAEKNSSQALRRELETNDKMQQRLRENSQSSVAALPVVARAQSPRSTANPNAPEVLPPIVVTAPPAIVIPNQPVGKVPAMLIPSSSEAVRPVGAVVPIPNQPVAPAVVGQTASVSQTPARTLGDAQVRIVASVNSTPIYESEVREAVAQRFPEFINLPAGERETEERRVYQEELRRVIERELLLDEMFTILRKNRPKAIEELQEYASKDADKRLVDFRKNRGIPSEEVMREALASQGLTVAGLKRSLERTSMMNMYLRERISPRIKGINLRQVRDYYEEHPDDFRIEDNVKWQDMFIHAEKFRTRAEAKQYADSIVGRLRSGEDFLVLAKQFDMGLSAGPKGAGFGEKKGEIRPEEAEPVVLALKPGEVNLVEIESGYHIVRVAERAYAGVRPFDEKAQKESRQRVEGQIFEAEAKRIVNALWRKVQPKIFWQPTDKIAEK